MSTDWRNILARDDMDLVDICAPNGVHAEIACAAAEHGKAMVCEKPLASDLEAARRMAEAVECAGVRNVVIFNYRYAPAVRHAAILLTSGQLGEVRRFRMHFLQDWLLDASRPMTWRLRRREGGGALLDLGAHLVDLVHYLVGPIVRVAAADAVDRYGVVVTGLMYGALNFLFARRC